MQSRKDEMARPDIGFEGSSDKYAVQSRSPIFFDEYDIAYLYQFPPQFWTGAMAARYNQFLYEAKTQGDKYNDIQDVAIKSQGGATIIFKQRNTFAKHLVDKIQRDIDVDFFRKHGKETEDIKKYRQQGEEHKTTGKDLGGYIGASLEDPVKKKVNVKQNGVDREQDLWAAKGFMAPQRRTIDPAIEKWKEQSAQGWLGDMHPTFKDSFYYSRGGHGRPKKGTPLKQKGDERVEAKKDVKSLSGESLLKMQKRMASLKAKPFDIVDDDDPHMVTWPDVVTVNKKGEQTEQPYGFTGSAKAKISGEPLPVLFDGAAIHSHDLDAYEATKATHDRFKNFNTEDLALLKTNLGAEIQSLREEITRKDEDDSWSKAKDSDFSQERKDKVERLAYLDNLEKLRDMTKKAYPDQPLDMNLVQHAIPKFFGSLNSEMEKIKSNARKYKEHHWNTHEYNREREPHDPVGVGMDNPAILGKRKYESLNGRSRIVGGYYPNNQTKQQMHGSEGEWESKYRDKFGVNKSGSHLSAEDKKDLDDKVNIYCNRIGQKLASDKEVLQYLGIDPSGHRPDTVQKLSNPMTLRKIIKSSHPEIEFNKGNNIISSGDMPDILNTAYYELKNTWSKASEVNNEVEEGTSKSAIMDGVKKCIQMKLYGDKHLQTAMEANSMLIAMNAENYIRRTVGHSAWRNYEDAAKEGGAAKHKAALDLRHFIQSKAFSYCGIIAQLKLGDDIETRRIRYAKPAMFSGAGGPSGGDNDNLGHDVDDEYIRKHNYDTDSEDEDGDDAANQFIRQNRRQAMQGASGKNIYGQGVHRGTRYKQSSDITGEIGSSVESYYKFLNSAEMQTLINKNASAGAEKMSAEKERHQLGAVTSQEVNMFHGISTAAAFFFVKRNEYIEEMKKKGTPVKDTSEADKVAHDMVIKHFKDNKWIAADYQAQAPAQPGLAAAHPASLPNIDDKVPEPEAEKIKRAALDLQPPEIGQPQQQPQQPTPQQPLKPAVPVPFARPQAPKGNISPLSRFRKPQ